MCVSFLLQCTLAAAFKPRRRPALHLQVRRKEEEKKERGEGEVYRRQVQVYTTSNSSDSKDPNTARAQAVWARCGPGIWRKGCACLSQTTADRGKMKPSEGGREKDGGRGRCSSVVFNPLKRGNTSMHTRAHRCKNIKSGDASDGIKARFVQLQLGCLCMCVCARLCVSACTCVSSAEGC